GPGKGLARGVVVHGLRRARRGRRELPRGRAARARRGGRHRRSRARARPRGHVPDGAARRDGDGVRVPRALRRPTRRAAAGGDRPRRVPARRGAGAADAVGPARARVPPRGVGRRPDSVAAAGASGATVGSQRALVLARLATVARPRPLAGARRAGAGADAEDAVQEVLARLAAGAELPADEARAVAYATTAVRRRALDLARRPPT